MTDSMLLADMDDVIGKMAALRAHGVSFALDDFGTSYSAGPPPPYRRWRALILQKGSRRKAW
nr:hypothetical protein [Duganella margarita]